MYNGKLSLTGRLFARKSATAGREQILLPAIEFANLAGSRRNHDGKLNGPFAPQLSLHRREFFLRVYNFLF
jgi:hypothetical protein